MVIRIVETASKLILNILEIPVFTASLGNLCSLSSSQGFVKSTHPVL